MDGIPKRDKVGLLVIDMQERFKPAIADFDEISKNISKLIKSFKVFGLPVFHTQQYTKGLGPTVSGLQELLKNPIEKTEFSCLDCPEFKEKLEKSGITQLVICGIESHVCVLQTALDAIAEGLEVFLVEDAISSRKESDKKIAIGRMAQSKVYRVSTEMIIFQLMEKAGTDEFREIQKIIR